MSSYPVIDIQLVSCFLCLFCPIELFVLLSIVSLKATVQVVILFGIDMWKLSPSAMKFLEGFHLKAASRMIDMAPKRGADGTWFYSSSKDVLGAAGLYMTKQYIEVQSQIIASFIMNQLIFDLRKRGGANLAPAIFGGGNPSTWRR